MKKFVALAAMLTAAAPAVAQEYRFTSADGSALSELCLAALESRDAMRERARELGMDDPEEETLVCNGLPVARFVRRYADVERVDGEPDRYVVTQRDLSAAR